MSAVLGVSCGYHDAAAALVVDGRIVAAMQEERFSRRKHDAALPRHAIRACLAAAGLHAGELTEVVYYENPYARLERVLVALLRAYPRSLLQFPRAMAAQLGDKLWVLDQLADLLDCPRARIVTREHHECHAASAFFTSPFPRAAVLTVDGVGEESSTAMWLGEGSRLTCLGTLAFPHSLGLLYAALTAWLGFAVNDGEYKVMGLAAYGKPRFRDDFSRLIALHGDGSFTLGLEYFAHFTDPDLGFGPALERLLGPRRPPGRPWRCGGDPEDDRYADVAATLQAVTEEALLGLAQEVRRRTGATALCLAGGVALNACANRRLAAESGFAEVYVHPASSDAGGALGAALLGALAAGEPRPPAMERVDLGLEVDADVVLGLAQRLGVRHRRVDDVATTVAELVARDRVVALARGRFEWGPRALGFRSVLASPRDPAMRERINRAIKHREPFRPFAPAVLAAATGRWFEATPDALTPFMTTVAPIRAERAAELGAVRHVDGTARLQTVTEASSPTLAAILGEMERRTGVPILLNTSLNGPGEPIVATAEDAVAFFVAHSVDAMVAGDVLLEREAGS